MALHQAAALPAIATASGLRERRSLCTEPSADGRRAGSAECRRRARWARMARLAPALGEFPRHEISRQPRRHLMIAMPNASIFKHWRPTPLISGSIALHLAAIAAVAVRPHAWPWALG